MKLYVVFGKEHSHNINGKHFDKDCVAAIKCNSPCAGRSKMCAAFGAEFVTSITDENWDHDWDLYYPRGFIELQ